MLPVIDKSFKNEMKFFYQKYLTKCQMCHNWSNRAVGQ